MTTTQFEQIINNITYSHQAQMNIMELNRLNSCLENLIQINDVLYTTGKDKVLLKLIDGDHQLSNLINVDINKESLEVTTEGVMDTIWNVIKAIFKRIMDTIKLSIKILTDATVHPFGMGKIKACKEAMEATTDSAEKQIAGIMNTTFQLPNNTKTNKCLQQRYTATKQYDSDLITELVDITKKVSKTSIESINDQIKQIKTSYETGPYKYQTIQGFLGKSDWKVSDKITQWVNSAELMGDHYETLIKNCKQSSERMFGLMRKQQDALDKSHLSPEEAHQLQTDLTKITAVTAGSFYLTKQLSMDKTMYGATTTSIINEIIKYVDKIKIG